MIGPIFILPFLPILVPVAYFKVKCLFLAFFTSLYNEDGPKQMGAQNNMGPKNRPQKHRTPKMKMGRRPKTPLWIQLDYEGQGPTSIERPNNISKGRMKTCQEPEDQGRPKHPPYPEATTVGGGSFPHGLRGTARSATLPAKRPLPTGILTWAKSKQV